MTDADLQTDLLLAKVELLRQTGQSAEALITLREAAAVALEPSLAAEYDPPDYAPIEVALLSAMEAETDSAAPVASAVKAMPATFTLAPVYPNPFQRSATVAFDLAAAAEVTIEVYDVLGRRVAVLAEGQHEAGHHTVRWDAAGLASGTYLLRATVTSGAGTDALLLTQRATLLN